LEEEVIHLVQISDGSSRRVALVQGNELRCLDKVQSVYELAQRSLRSDVSLSGTAEELARGEVLDYDAVYESRSDWRLLCPIDVPGNPSRVLVAGTGLTHLGSAKNRDAMHVEHASAAAPLTDSMKMFQWGVEAGRPEQGQIGIAPEWFYKGNGSVLQNPFSELTVPSYAEDGGEEAEIAGIYLIDENGVPHRLGMAMGNEFSDHKFERRNYLNLAGSKLRSCSLGPELVVGAPFRSVSGEAHIQRQGKTIWQATLETGEENMCHSLANLEHHHFKFEGHRQPGTIHVHFFGADVLSCGEGVEMQDGDWMEIRFDGFGRALRNRLHVESRTEDRPVEVHAMS
jgi:hypothetical protein